MTNEDFKDFYVENRFVVRDGEIQGNLDIGFYLKDATDKEIEDKAKTIKRHKSFLIECKVVFEKWKEIEGQYTKEKSWRDLVKLAGIEGEKRPRKSLTQISELITRRYMQHKEEFERTGDVYVKGKWDEDKEILKASE